LTVIILIWDLLHFNFLLMENGFKLLLILAYHMIMRVKLYGNKIKIIFLLNSFGQNGNNSEFWVALIEKAYSKLHGCYENIIDKNFVEGLVDLTGGLGEKINLAEFEN
jgi:hypothetical protein